MDDAVAEVFESMLNRSCIATQEVFPIPTDISARITLSGAIEAQCLVEFPASSAEKLTCAFLGSCDPVGEEGWDGAMICDSVGELCNMIAGGWKKRLGAAAGTADLSVPLITTGPCSGSVPHAPQPATIPAAIPATIPTTIQVRRAYAFDDSPFAVIMTKL